jgi:DNA-binding NarL/FixJ family response regulator
MLVQQQITDMVFRRQILTSSASRATRATALVSRLRPVKVGASKSPNGTRSLAPEIRIVTADCEAESRRALGERLAAQPDFTVVGQARDAVEVVTLTAQLNPDILLLDFSMYSASGVELIERLRHQAALRIIFLIDGATRCFDVVDLLRLGARGVVSKESSAPHLFKSIRSVFNGDVWLTRQELADAVKALTSVSSRRSIEPGVQLTTRQREVLALVASGGTNKEVARRLSISEDTVKHHMTKILDRTGMSTRVELVVFAIERRLVESA